MSRQPTGPVPLEDAKIISLLMHKPKLNDVAKHRYLNRLQDEQCRQVAAVLLGFRSYASAPAYVKVEIDSINRYRKNNGIPEHKDGVE